MSIVRVWKLCKNSKDYARTNWTIWDRGDEMWELRGDVLRHFELLERFNDDNVITERLRLLPESAIPLEAIRHSIQGWQVEESVVKFSPQVKPALPLTSSPLSTPTPSPRINVLAVDGQTSPERIEQKTPLHAGRKPKATVIARLQGNEKDMLQCMSENLLEERIHHVTPLQSTQGTLEEESSQHFYNHPTELWSSLSQWIPPHALFQPSLHHQATLELSDTPAQTYPYQIDSSKNSRPVQGQRQHAKQGQHSKPYRPKPSLREIEIPKRPLFV